jgi:hypothetical protein
MNLSNLDVHAEETSTTIETSTDDNDGNTVKTSTDDNDGNTVETSTENKDGEGKEERKEKKGKKRIRKTGTPKIKR